MLNSGKIEIAYNNVDGEVNSVDVSKNTLQITDSYLKFKRNSSLVGGNVVITRTGKLTGDIKANQNTVILRDSQISPNKDIDIVGAL